MQPVVGPTPTQYALAICFLVIEPALGIAAMRIQWRRGANVFSGALATTFAAWAGWTVSCVVALVLFAGYPHTGRPPEPVAMLFTLPGFVTGALVLAWLAATRRAPTRGRESVSRAGSVALVALTSVLALALVSGHRAATTWPARRALPDSAQVVSEEAYQDAFLGDFRYELRARMSRDALEEWMRSLHLDARPDDPTRYEREGSDPSSCGAAATYIDGIAHYVAWCA